MRILAVTSGRADATPLRPVLSLLKGHYQHIQLEAYSPEAAVERVRGRMDIHKFDVLLILGDRYESLAAALAATYERIPIAHIHGGEASFGSFDNQIRDAITKLAHIHFVAAAPMKQRLLDLGEEEHRIHVVGAPGLDNLTNLPERKPGKYFVVTYHPATLGSDRPNNLLSALNAFSGYEKFWTSSNNDPGCDDVKHAFNISLGHSEFWTAETYRLMCYNAAAVVGNSSSGLIEMPALEVPTVNVGSRQDGRLKGPSVFDCTEDQRDIEKALRASLEYDGPYTNPYGEPGASKKIADILSSVEIDMRKEWRT